MPNAPNNADQTQLIDHLFRHQFGKMVSILTRIFGLAHLETIEDAVQDTFIKAMGAWRNGIPENPEAWLTQAAKNRTIDLFRQLKSEKERAPYFESGPAAIAINELFLDREIADSQLRMIFTACHPALDPRDQIAFALKTISGFSQSEIASALLTKEESVKKRLSRARNMIRDAQLAFAIPQGNELSDRLPRVLEVLYLIFNEGFHSGQKEMLVRKELCAEAMRLCKMLVDHKEVCSPNVQALFALMCFQAARLDSKVNELQEVIDLRQQDRSLWHFPLIVLGNQMMFMAVNTEEMSVYHYEAAIASEHLKASTFEATDWDRILMWYERLQVVAPSPFNSLNMAVVHIQRNDLEAAKLVLDSVVPEDLEQRAYLYHGCMAEYHRNRKDKAEALAAIEQAIQLVTNEHERNYLLLKKEKITAMR